MSDAAEKLESLPRQFGDWEACGERRLDENTEKMLECAGHISRRYVNRRTNAEISMIVLLGPSGPIAVHTPEICFSSRDYETKQAREAIQIDDQNQLWNVTFRSLKLDAESLSVYYGWSVGDKWAAADDPRYDFAGSPYLYKIQLAGTATLGNAGKSNDDCRVFLSDFLPVLKKHLIEPSK